MILLFPTVVLFLSGCAVVPHTALYRMELTDVVADACTDTTLVGAISGEGKMKYETPEFVIEFLPTTREMNFELFNKTCEDMRIHWDEAVFVDTKGACHPVVHADIRYVDRYLDQRATKVLGGAAVHDMVIPRDYVSYQPFISVDHPGGWETKPYLPSEWYGDFETFAKWVESYTGKTVEVLLPLEHAGTVYPYRFRFTVTTARTVDGTRAEIPSASKQREFMP